MTRIGSGRGRYSHGGEFLALGESCFVAIDHKTWRLPTSFDGGGGVACSIP